MSLGTQEQRTEGMKKQVQELIGQAYRSGYKKAEEDYYIQTEKDRESSYQLGIEVGRNEAWELAYRLVFNHGNIRDVFDTESLGRIFETYSASEAIEKIRVYEDKKHKQEEICEGDEVKNKYGLKYFVTGINDNMCWGIGKTGYFQDDIKFVKKTGNHFDAITEVMKKIREGDADEAEGHKEN